LPERLRTGGSPAGVPVGSEDGRKCRGAFARPWLFHFRIKIAGRNFYPESELCVETRFQRRTKPACARFAANDCRSDEAGSDASPPGNYFKAKML
jgi:hypothetical protein